MAFMEMYILNKGATYTCDCGKCGASLFTHEWADVDHNDRRDAMQAGELACHYCGIGKANPDTFTKMRDQYAGRYSANGYMDCTDWHFDTNKKRLARELRDMYGD